MVVAKREMVLGALELAFERSVAAQKIGLPVLLHYFELRLPDLFDGRKLAIGPLWEELRAEDGIEPGDLDTPLLALKAWEALFGVLVDLPAALDKADFDERKRAVTSLGFHSSEAAKLIAERAERSGAPGPLSTRRRITEVLQAMDATAMPTPAPARPRRASEEAPVAPPRRAAADAAPARRATASRRAYDEADRRRRLVLAALGAVALAAAGWAYLEVREPPAEAIDAAALKAIVVLNKPQQRGSYFVAEVADPRWAKWTEADRVSCVRKLLEKLARMDVLVVTLVGSQGELLAQGNRAQNQIQVFGH